MLAAKGSVFLKAAALTAITAVIVAVMVQVASTRSGYDLIYKQVGGLMVAETISGAELIGGHLTFGKVDGINAELDKLSEMEGERFVELAVWNAKGDIVTNKGVASPAEEAELARLAKQAMATGKVARADGQLIAAVPVYYRNSAEPIGAIGTIWTPDGLLADLLLDAAPAMAVAMLITVMLVAGSALLLRRMIGTPLAEVGGAMGQIAKGSYDNAVPRTDRGDEIGGIARSLDTLRTRLQAAKRAEEDAEKGRAEQTDAVERLGDALTALARGDLTQSLTTSFGEGYDRLRLDYNATVDTLNDIMGSINENAKEIHTRAEEISGASEDLSQRTENQAATLEETAAAMDEMTSSVRSAAESAAEVEKVVKDARQGAEESGRVVTDAIGAMSGIKKSSDEISQIIGVIDDIAFQTNLLALNAGVEAARAGEAGRGFAVVASEVRALAQRSSEAAKEIKDLISTSSEQVDSGVSLVNRTGDALSDIVKRVSNIADLIGEIATGAQEQSVGLGEINVGVNQLDKVTQQNAAMVEEATAASTTLKQEAQTLQGLVDRFQLRGGGRPVGVASAPAAQFSHSPVPVTPETEFEVALARDSAPKSAANDSAWQDF
ncbi:Methyl-accepting chemotaxis protein I (serine chemoreceptor protein) [Rhodovulum sp. P5]|nr:Methyl-accepting chemotaxis protein I (serine chemoreceptor protein) [Rhodovulum sp. P5]